MKKIAVVSAILFLVPVLSGCTKDKQNAVDMNNMPQKQSAQKEDNNKGSFLGNIKDAISSGQKMKCTYVIQQDGSEFKSEAFIDGEKYKSTSSFDGQTTYAVFDGKVSYTWTDQSKQGMKIDTDCIEQTSNQVQEQEQMDKERAQKEADPFEGAVDVKCEKVDSIDFSLPTDVEFTDQCELIKQQQQQLEQLQQNLPQGLELPEGVEIPAAQ